MKKALKRVSKKREKLVERACHLNNQIFEKYAPLTKDLRLDRRGATFGNFLIILRRCTMLVMAMFVVGHQWLHLQVFINLTLTSVIFVASVRPYETGLLNNLNLFNEVTGLLVAYVILVLQNKGYDPEQLYEIGNIAVYILYASGAVNLCIILAVTATSAFGKARKHFL